MAERADPMQIVTFEELLRACLYEQEALQPGVGAEGLVTNEEVLEEVKAVRRELEAKRGSPRPSR